MSERTLIPQIAKKYKESSGSYIVCHEDSDNGHCNTIWEC